jgi:ELWxxDGT repeat protein
MNKIKYYFTIFLFVPFFVQAQVLLKDINTTNRSSHPYSAFDLNGNALFIANSQLWKTDGTTANTSMIANPNQYPYNGPYFSNITKLKLNNNMIFVSSGSDGSGNYVGTELWKTDGTTGGTILVADINIGSNSSSPELLVTIGNYMYFSASTSTAGRELWSTDGTTVNFLGDIYAGSNNSNYYYTDSYAALGTKMIFRAYDSTNGSELWVTDGTQAGTFLLKDINPGSNSSSISNFTEVGSKVYFSAYNPTYGSELWVTDGTSAGTQMVLDIYSSSCLPCYSNPSNLREFNGTLIFSAQSSNFGTELWKSDGTVVGTVLLKNINPASSSSSPQDLTKVGNKIFFTAENGTVGRELWVTDGTTTGTNLVKNINLSNSVGDITFPLSSIQRKFINVNGTLFFIANSGIEGYELWKSDGTTAGTTLIKDFLPSTLSGGYSNFTVVGSKLYFIVEENGIKKLCVSDGTVAGSQALETLSPSVDMTNGYPLIGIGNTLLFVAYHSQYGYELYKTDGTSAGTSFLKDIDTSTFNPGGFNLKASNNNATLFNYNNNKNGLELWRTDGSTTGTQEMINLTPYPISSIGSYNGYYSGSSSIGQIIVFNNEFYISMSGAI